MFLIFSCTLRVKHILFNEILTSNTDQHEKHSETILFHYWYLIKLTLKKKFYKVILFWKKIVCLNYGPAEVSKEVSTNE